jgi:hypothetical protein
MAVAQYDHDRFHVHVSQRSEECKKLQNDRLSGGSMHPKKLNDYLTRAKTILNLSHWEIKISTDSPPDDAWADVEVSQNLYAATIRFSHSLWKEKPEEIRRVIAHELIHCHYAGVERLVEVVQDSLGTAAGDIVGKIWDVESERGADSLSTAVAELLPLPAFGEK